MWAWGQGAQPSPAQPSLPSPAQPSSTAAGGSAARPHLPALTVAAFVRLCAGADDKLYATFIPAEDPSAAAPGAAPRGVSILARDLQVGACGCMLVCARSAELRIKLLVLCWRTSRARPPPAAHTRALLPTRLSMHPYPFHHPPSWSPFTTPRASLRACAASGRANPSRWRASQSRPSASCPPPAWSSRRTRACRWSTPALRVRRRCTALLCWVAAVLRCAAPCLLAGCSLACGLAVS